MATTTTRTCPKCGGSLIPAPGDPTRRTCAGCGARFLVPTNPAAPSASVRAGAPAAVNAFADLSAPSQAAARRAHAPAAKPRPSTGIDPRLGIGLLIAGLAVVLVGLTTAIVLAVIFWPRPAVQPAVVVVAPVDAPAVLPTPDPEPPPAATKPPVADSPKPTPPPSKPAPPKDDPPPIPDAPPPLQPAPPPPPPDVKPAPPPQPAPDVKADDPVNKAIDKAVVYLKKEALNAPQPAAGGLAIGFVGRQTGEMGLIGLALLESGVPADDPAVAACVNAVRSSGPLCNNTYEMAICLWFLDRLGDPKDEDLIHDLGARLIAGQLEHGKWTYQCPTGSGAAPKGLVPPARLGLAANELTQDQLKELMEILDKYNPSQEIPAKQRLAPVCHYVRGKKIEKAQALARGMMFNTGDLSLTQFAVLGLWVARKHHLPVDRSLLLAEAFVRSCQEADGGWAYSGVGRLGMGTTDSMTCSGLMELAVGRAVGQSQGGKTELADPQFEKGIQYLAELFDRGVAPPKPGDAKQAQNLQQASARLLPLVASLFTPVFPGQKQNWNKGLQEFQAELEKTLALDLPADVLKDLKEIDDYVKKVRAGGAATPKEKMTLQDLVVKSGVFQAGGVGPNPFGLGRTGRRFLKPGKSNRANLDDIYCLWSVERLAMVCDLKTIAGRDWYAWGANLLVAYQNDDGSWADAGICGQRVDACLAVLFLKRVNVAKDLTAQLKMIAPIKDLSPDKLKYVSPGDTPSPGDSLKESPKP